MCAGKGTWCRDERRSRLLLQQQTAVAVQVVWGEALEELVAVACITIWVPTNVSFS